MNARILKISRIKNFLFQRIIIADINLNNIGQLKINKKCLILNKKINYNQLKALNLINYLNKVKKAYQSISKINY